MRNVLFLYVTCILTHFCDSHFLGGSISWTSDTGANNVRFTYRLTWKKGSGPCGPTCSTGKIGSPAKGSVTQSVLAALKWKFDNGNTSVVLNDINYYVTSVSINSPLGWEQGENSFTYSAFKTNQSYMIYLDAIPWLPSSLGTNLSPGYMETSLDLRHRSDTGKSNNSPYVSVQPFIGVAFGCTTTVRLPVDDPDGDIVRCRWALQHECRHACTNTPTYAVRISKANCTVTVQAFNETGFTENSIYRLALVIEDFPQGSIDVGADHFTRQTVLSRIPLQLTLKTSFSGVDCTQKLSFVRPTAKNFARFNTEMSQIRQLKSVDNSFYLQTNDVKSTEFMGSFPRYMKYKIVPDDLSSSLNRTNVSRMSTSWLIRPFQSGNQQFCVWGLRAEGVTSDARCLTDIVMDTNYCSKRTCYNKGSCVNLFHVTNEICSCPVGYKPPDCSKEVVCADDPCANKASCKQHGSNYSCACQKGFSGINCEHEEYHCTSSPCKNNGTCLDLQLRYMCLCIGNFSGQNCETDISRQTEVSLRDAIVSGTNQFEYAMPELIDIPLTNSKSMMQPVPSISLHRESSSRDSSDIWIPLLISAASLITLAILSGCIYVYKRSFSSAQDGKTNQVTQKTQNTTDSIRAPPRSQTDGTQDWEDIDLENNSSSFAEFGNGVTYVQPAVKTLGISGNVKPTLNF